jgi:hypothetical protein
MEKNTELSRLCNVQLWYTKYNLLMIYVILMIISWVEKSFVAWPFFMYICQKTYFIITRVTMHAL